MSFSGNTDGASRSSGFPAHPDPPTQISASVHEPHRSRRDHRHTPRRPSVLGPSTRGVRRSPPSRRLCEFVVAAIGTRYPRIWDVSEPRRRTAVRLLSPPRGDETKANQPTLVFPGTGFVIVRPVLERLRHSPSGVRRRSSGPRRRWDGNRLKRRWKAGWPDLLGEFRLPKGRDSPSYKGSESFRATRHRLDQRGPRVLVRCRGPSCPLASLAVGWAGPGTGMRSASVSALRSRNSILAFVLRCSSAAQRATAS